MCYSLKKWVTGTNFFVYVSHFLSAWGDRMWAFGVGLFLVNIASENLQLTAIYGLSNGLTIFFLGALVGDWVDTTARLKAAQLSLVMQNIFVVVCAAGIYVFLWYQPYLKTLDGNWQIPLYYAGIIILAIFSNLASLARMLAVERDWIVEICGKDKDMLAVMTASLRRIDQATLILAPIATGQIMTYAGLENGAIFIGGWNVLSVFIEYYLMWKVYETVPALRAKKDSKLSNNSQNAEAENELNTAVKDHREEETENEQLTLEANDPLERDEASLKPSMLEGDSIMPPNKEEESQHQEKSPNGRKNGKSTLEKVFSRFITLYRGWRTYMQYSVALAGLALACLYMTVLGFDNITVAYAVTQGVPEYILGLLMGASAVFGILGTFVYPVLRHRVGLVRTGIFGLSAEVLCLILCVVSIWMPGSPFDPFYRSQAQKVPSCNSSTAMQPMMENNISSFPSSSLSSQPPHVIFTLQHPNATSDNNATECVQNASEHTSYISVGMLIGGIVLARSGLWIADLTITQLFLEDVQEKDRGIVSGVQSSLNKLMDVLKFVLVTGVPDTETFGFLIIISFAFIFLGWLLYAIFLRKNRGHFFHFEKCLKNGAPATENTELA
ncbi:solute carrier family 40 member 1-like isoform X3 [Pomacea canaliculata]|uniref:solute carrier family 40 member 1-like isoform X3 n=1 Tax=Pomacea canaliculata TaxID=400727 RepID=UPI000D730C27|nr:solute carrier family 40 member 1-like isoform X3 [Pomacea canaliculata]